jgi:hypothetical protein
VVNRAALHVAARRGPCASNTLIIDPVLWPWCRRCSPIQSMDVGVVLTEQALGSFTAENLELAQEEMVRGVDRRLWL